MIDEGIFRHVYDAWNRLVAVKGAVDGEQQPMSKWSTPT